MLGPMPVLSPLDPQCHQTLTSVPFGKHIGPYCCFLRPMGDIVGLIHLNFSLFKHDTPLNN